MDSFNLLVALTIVNVVSAVAAWIAGGGFLWGLFLGPVGVLVSALIAQGEKTRKHIEVATDAILKKL